MTRRCGLGLSKEETRLHDIPAAAVMVDVGVWNYRTHRDS
jgi:hypothetical protein